MQKWILVTLLLLASCTKEEDLQSQFSDGLKKWNAQRPERYTVTVQVQCFCVPARTGPHRMVVENNRIVTVNGAPYNPTLTGPLLTIDELFDFVREGLRSNPAQTELRFHPVHGYPEKVYLDFDAGLADEEQGYLLTDFIAG